LSTIQEMSSIRVLGYSFIGGRAAALPRVEARGGGTTAMLVSYVQFQ
jgi:hypothetical protein